MACVGGLNAAAKCSGRLRDGAPEANLKKLIFAVVSQRQGRVFLFLYLRFSHRTSWRAQPAPDRVCWRRLCCVFIPPCCLLCEPYMPVATARCSLLTTAHVSRVCARETVRPRETVRHQRGKRGWKSMQPRADFTLSPRADNDYCCCSVFFFFLHCLQAEGQAEPGANVHAPV